MMWCLKTEVYFEYSWTFDQYPIQKKKLPASGVFLRCIYLFEGLSRQYNHAEY